MKRDSESLSVWQKIIPFINTNNETDTSKVYDVIVVGAGITGLTTALMLQEAGKKCLLLEAQNIGYGTTSATTAHINTVLDTPYTSIIKGFGLDHARLIAQGAKDAIALIKRNVDHYSITCDFEYREGYLYAETEEEVKELEALYEAIQQVGLDCYYIDKIPVPVPFLKAIQFDGQAQFHPVKYILALAEAFTEKGGVIIEGERAIRLEEKEAVKQLFTETSSHKADAVVYATHLPPGISTLDFKCAPYRTYVLGVELEDESQYPDSLIYDSQDPYHYFRTAYLNDEKLLIVGGNDHKTGHNENTDHIFMELEAYVRKYYKVKSIPYKWSSQYYESADGLPYIGALPESSNQVYVATGYGGNGMIYGTLAARIISDLLLTGENQYAKLLSPSRIKPIAAFKNFVKENADVVKHFIADRFSSKDLQAFADIGKEEGRIVKYMEHNIALYKDEYGNLKALSPVCPHVGCIVSWNSAEKSWDCPCHGARYDTDGNILVGPSTKGLKKIMLE